MNTKWSYDRTKKKKKEWSRDNRQTKFVAEKKGKKKKKWQRICYQKYESESGKFQMLTSQKRMVEKKKCGKKITQSRL